MPTTPTYTTHHLTSKDGTTIGYRALGSGPGLILIHGGMMAAQNLMKLGELLAHQFTIYIPDRQGRGLSHAHTNFGLKAESEDLQALALKTGTTNIYGLSAGAVITLQTVLIEKSIKKIVLHEPPILTSDTKALAWIDNYRKVMAKGHYGRAFISVVHGTDDPSSLFNRLPGFLTAPLMNLAIKADAKKAKENPDDINLKALVAAMVYDIKVVEDSKGLLEKAQNITADVLLLKGQKSQPYLRNAIDKLSTALPKAQLIDIPGQGHTVSDNGGKPELVAKELIQFFGH
jgi:pimeloyl-ACP methyl ester carboxylesterase